MNYQTIPGLKYRQPPDPNNRTRKVVDAVCESFGVNMDQIKGKRRQRRIVLPRQIIMFFLRKHTKMGWREIGCVFKRDHTTAIHSFSTVRNLYDTDPILRDQINEIENKILS